MNLRLSARSTIGSSSALLGFLLAACSGREIPLGTGVESSGDSVPVQGVGGCSPEQCSQQAIQCARGVASNVQCVPDPNRGQGSAAADACILTADCADPVACDAFLCNGQQITCDGGTAHCVESPIVSIGKRAGGSCQLACISSADKDGGPQRAGASVDAGPVGNAGPPQSGDQ